MHACRNVESLLAERGEDVKQVTQDTIEFTPEDLIGQSKMEEIAQQFSLRQRQEESEEQKGQMEQNLIILHAVTKLYESCHFPQYVT